MKIEHITLTNKKASVWLILGFFTLAAVVAWLLALPAAAAPSADPGPQWVLLWSDDFNGTSIDTTKWNVSNGHSGINNELEYYNPDDVYLDGAGNLVLRSRKDVTLPGAGFQDYTSGQVNTAGKFDFLYGRMEVRAKLPTGKGLWPAHWTLSYRCTASADVSGCRFWPPEIDIMEMLGQEPTKVYQTYHYSVGNSNLGYGVTYTGPDFSAAYHTYEAEWDPGEIRFYVDGIRTGSTTTAITNIRQHLILQTAVGGNWPGAPDATTVFPQYHSIDYIRVFQLCPTCTPQATTTPSSTPPPSLTPTLVPNGGSARVELGGTSSYTDSVSNVWTPDAGCSGGGGIVDRGNIAIANTVDDRIYQTEHWGMTNCVYNVASGSYTVKLHFAETIRTSAGQRVFSVNVEGQALNNLDVFAQAGGMNTALIKTFVVNVTDGQLTITFTPSVDQPEINGVEILPPGPTPTPGPTFTPAPTATPTPVTANTHTGTWAAKGTLGSRSTWKDLRQAVTMPANTNLVASLWIKGVGSVELAVLDPGFSVTFATKRCDAIGSWTQCTTSAFNNGTQTQLSFRVRDFYDDDPVGTAYVDDTFLGVSGGANVLVNPGFESGAVTWTAQSPAWSIVNNP